MNKVRRKKLSVLLEKLEGVSEEIESVRQEEECILDSTPENLQNSQRYQDAEENVCDFGDAITGITDVCCTLQGIIDR